MDVCLVWHVHHPAGDNRAPVLHLDEMGEVPIDEQAGDDVKLLGVYASEPEAQSRIRRARAQPGFSDEPHCFIVVPYTLGEDAWTEGYVTADD